MTTARVSKGKKVFVHRYKWGHEHKRSTYRKLLKQNKVVLLETLRDGWLYQHVEVIPKKKGWGDE